MKREGKQHGMARTYMILPNPIPGTRFINRFDSPPTAGLFTKVPSKPTNHSKFTGKCFKSRCTGCRLHPVSKSKNKSKGNSKHLRFMDQSNSKLVGLSATGILNHITNCYMDDTEVEDEKVDYVDNYVNYSCYTDKEVEFPLLVEQVEEEKHEDEDWEVEDDYVDNYVNHWCTVDKKEWRFYCLLNKSKKRKKKNKSKGNSKHLRLMDQSNSKLVGLSATGTSNHITNCYMEVEDEKVDHADNYVNYSSTTDEEEVEIPLPIEKVEGEKYEDEDWEAEDEKVDHVNNYVNYWCTMDDEEVEILLPIEQVEEEKYEDEDWYLVERC